MSDDIELVGDRVRLRSTVEADGPALIAIRASEEVRRRWRGDDLEAEFADDLEDDETTRLTIEVDGRIIGLIQFAEADDADYRHASIDIYVDPSVHRRGHASDAIRTLADHLFDDRGHHRLTIDPAADNAAAIACYRSVGFSDVGVMRGYERQPHGTWVDGLLMEMLESDRATSRSPAPALRFVGTVINAADPDALASFYERLLGWPRFMDDSEWIALRHGDGTAIAFQLAEHAVAPAWPTEPGRPHSLTHLDFSTDDLDCAVEHAIEVGATLTGASVVETERVMLDPAGNPFCLIAPPTSPQP